MKQIIATSPVFEGELVIVYDPEGELVDINFQSCKMSHDQKAWIKHRIPVIYEEQDFLSRFAKVDIAFVPTDVLITFEMFWKRYAHTPHKQRAVDAWNDPKFSDADKVKAYCMIPAYDRFLKNKQNWRSKADAGNYLKDKYFNDEWR